MKYLIIIIISVLSITQIQAQNATDIINKVDANMNSKTNITKSNMIIYGRRNNRTVTSIGYSEGKNKSFSEYLAPEREKGTKMLKLDDYLWIYSPSTDRTIQLSGHMLKQSLMGSDLSYEDMMENRKLMDMYNAEIVGKDTIEGREVVVILLKAKVDDAIYESRKTWIDVERYVPLKEELYAKSGSLLKRVIMSDIKKVDGRWYPTKMNYKDMLKKGKGTDFVILDIEFDADIPVYIFSKASLKK